MVEGLSGSEVAKRRLKLVLETISGELKVIEACERLGISKTAFFELRSRVLQASVEELEPKPVGRPRNETSAEQVEVQRLEQENKELRENLEIAHVREEIMLAMPEVFEPGREEKKRPSTKAELKKKKQRRLQKKSRQKSRRS
jgi:transposase-like protein